MKIPIIESEIFRLRPIVKKDIDSIAKYSTDRTVSRYTFVPYPNTPDKITDFLRRSRASERKGTGLNFGIEFKESGEIIGLVSFGRINRQFRRGEIGYWISRKYRNMGIMSESLRLVTQYAFKDLKLMRVHAFVEPGNLSSVKVLEKCGYQREGLLKKFMFKNNRYRDVLIYANVRLR